MPFKSGELALQQLHYLFHYCIPTSRRESQWLSRRPDEPARAQTAFCRRYMGSIGGPEERDKVLIHRRTPRWRRPGILPLYHYYTTGPPGLLQGVVGVVGGRAGGGGDSTVGPGTPASISRGNVDVTATHQDGFSVSGDAILYGYLLFHLATPTPTAPTLRYCPPPGQSALWA